MPTPFATTCGVAVAVALVVLGVALAVRSGFMAPGHDSFAACTADGISPAARAEADALQAAGAFPGSEGFATRCGPTAVDPIAASQALAQRQLAGGRYIEGRVLPGTFGAAETPSPRFTSPDSVAAVQSLSQANALPLMAKPSGVDLYGLPGFGLGSPPVPTSTAAPALRAEPPDEPVTASALNEESDDFANRSLRRQQGAFSQIQKCHQSMAAATGGPDEKSAQFASMRDGFGGPPTDGMGWHSPDRCNYEATGYGWYPSDSMGPVNPY